MIYRRPGHHPAPAQVGLRALPSPRIVLAMQKQCLSGLLGCNVYVSEGHNMQLIRTLQGVCTQHRHVLLANTFVDAPYNRTGFTLVSPGVQELGAAAAATAAAGAQHIDLRRHTATHPRLGAVDHISCHPLGAAATLAAAAALAHAIGSQLAQAPTGLPVYYYGAASSSGRRLADIRRQLGYFHSSQAALDPPSVPATAAAAVAGAGEPAQTHHEQQQQQQQQQQHQWQQQQQQQQWQGPLGRSCLQHFPPDAGPPSAAAASGIITIGAVPWVVNYNVPVKGGSLQAAKAVAREVSARGGGLPSVEAMALEHEDTMEVACNLLQCQVSSPEQVQAAVAAAARRHGLQAGEGYVIGHLPSRYCNMAAEHARQQQQQQQG